MRWSHRSTKDGTGWKVGKKRVFALNINNWSFLSGRSANSDAILTTASLYVAVVIVQLQLSQVNHPYIENHKNDYPVLSLVYKVQFL